MVFLKYLALDPMLKEAAFAQIFSLRSSMAKCFPYHCAWVKLEDPFRD